MSDGHGETLYGYRLRREQRRVLAYRGGRLAVSAVPGSGKTLTLSLLAARLILEGRIGARGEVLLVTVQNSAVTNIAQRIRQILAAQHAPAVGYRVCTLHRLAADILRRRQDLAGVDDTFSIIDDAESGRLIARAVSTWRAGHGLWWESFLPEAGQGNRADAERRWREETERVGREVIKLCKHLRLTPAAARTLLDRSGGGNDEFLRMGLDIYDLYDGYLQVRGGLDFDDLIWRAITALEEDEGFCAGLRARWPVILEDEAQDSSPLQERILSALAGPDGSWVRVGDPNQSINSTFTAADPRYFRRFVGQEGVRHLSLPQSGRCGRPIMRLANRLVEWTLAEHPEPDIRDMAFQPQEMVPTEPGDPQENPPDAECWIYFLPTPHEDERAEGRALADLAARFVAKHPDRTCAVLCPTHWLGAHVVEALAGRTPPVPYDDLLRSTPRTRSVAGLLAAVLRYLASPTQGQALAALVRALAEGGHLGPAADAGGAAFRGLVSGLQPERLFFPDDVLDVRDMLPRNVPVTAEQVALLGRMSGLVARWVRAASLPIDQLILTVAQDLYEDETLLATCHMLASSLRATADTHPEWRLWHHAEELDAVAHNRRTIGGLSLTDTGYVDQPGTVVVTTWHKAKGLEWDTVFLMGVDSLEFPSRCGDTFRDGPYFMPGRAPAIEARKRLEQAAGADFCCPEGVSLVEAARLECIAERLRLLYVGITRARRYLVFSHCRGRRGRAVQPAAPLAVLQADERPEARRSERARREEVERVR